jgi:AbrB family looped-hinge helix DNA binding protein
MRSKIKAMLETEKKNFSVERLGEQGQITLPDEYRRALDLSSGSQIVLLQVGDALVVTPFDEELSNLTSHLESAMHEAGCSVEDLLEEARKARAEIVQEEFGEIK